jgi:predicted secreted Zn-dependent protease
VGDLSLGENQMTGNRFFLTALVSAIVTFLTSLYFNVGIKAQLTIPAAETNLSANPMVSVQMIHYPISGATSQELREQMNLFGPLDERLDRRFDGYTRWYVRWNYQYAQSQEGCRIDKAKVKTEVTMTLPQWETAPTASPELNTEWNRYITALQTHENGHKQHGLNAGNEILQTLTNLSIQPSCNELDVAANTASDRIIQHYSQEDFAYDQATGHGATQGAIFPSNQVNG